MRGFAILDPQLKSEIANGKTKMVTQSSNKRRAIPDGTWIKCSDCGEIIYNGELSRNLRICPKCDFYFPLEPAKRIALLVDKGSFARYNTDCQPPTCLDGENCDRTVITGEATLSGHRLVIAAINFYTYTTHPTLASEAIGLFVCGKIVRTVAQAADQRLPLLLISTNSIEAQLQNDMFPSARILSISAAMGRLAREKIAYISILANSNSHGYFPGFAYVADIVIAESNTQRTLRSGRLAGRGGTSQAVQTLFQNGMVDMIVSRRELKHILIDTLNFLC